MSTGQPTTGDTVRGGLVVAVGLGVTNVTAYAYTILAARLLGPVGYGTVAALLGLVIIGNVFSLGLQATGARRLATQRGHGGNEEEVAAVVVTARRVAGVLALFALAISPLVAQFLRLDPWFTATLLAIPAGAYAVMGADLGILQGEQRWVAFAVSTAALGVGRLGVAVVTTLAFPTPLGAMAGIAAGAFVPVAAARLAVGRRRRAAARRAPATGMVSQIVAESAQNIHALLAFFVLSSMDVVVARIGLPAQQAGLYAGGAILTKAVLFLPYALTVLVFPALARTGARTRLHLVGLAGVLLIGAAVAAVVAAVPGITLVFVGGDAYADISGSLWAFAALGAVLAGIQILLYATLARQRHGAVWILWAGVIVVASGFSAVDSATGLLRLLAGVDLAVLVALLWWTRNESAADQGVG
ncbi:MAG: oligosaccharide flippase family protein [Nostocoides sp.]